MRKATRSDMRHVAEIIFHTFSDNPGVNWMLRQGGSHERKIRRLADHAFMKAFVRDGVYISSNGKGVALCYRFNHRVFSFRAIYYELRFALTSISLKHLPAVIRRESYREKQRPSSGDYLYFWFLGVLPGGERAVFELRDGIYEYARRECRPIDLETAMDRNRAVYERYGYETYHCWEEKDKNIRFWFMKLDPGEK
jgi:hypothetical protein